jgi:hypothetical protein
MAFTDENISAVRRWSLAAVGLCCVGYAVMALGQNRPDPVLWYLPGLAGSAAAFGVFLTFCFAGPQAIAMASDELYASVNQRAQRHAYWVAVLMYPAFGIFGTSLGLHWDTIFAAMGTLNAASYLLLVTLYDWRTS